LSAFNFDETSLDMFICFDLLCLCCR